MRSGASILSPGDLIYVRTCPRREVGARRSGATTGGRPCEPAARVALLMVAGWEGNAMRLRLVQDFGRPEDAVAPAAASEPQRAAPAPAEAAPAPTQAHAAPAASAPAPAVAVATPALPQASGEPSAPAPVEPARRGRGRPPGSRTRKPAFPGLRSAFR
jgi:hypothetical protein